MYIKLINPKTHGLAAYNNNGSSLQTLNYLVQEAKREQENSDIFFNQEEDKLTSEQVRQDIDTNVKGLSGKDAKFYSLIISPSADELSHIKNDEQLLKFYTRQVMELYAQNYKLKEDRQLTSQNLVWGAAIHHYRSYRGTDKEVLAGTAKVGEKRPGLQTHVHVIVSARDREQKITLNPNARKERFNLIDWQRKSGQLFEKHFRYTAQEKEKIKVKQRDPSRDAVRALRIRERVNIINTIVPPAQRLDAERVNNIANGRNYDKTFYRSLNRVELKAQQGKPIDNAYHLLETGREQNKSTSAPTRNLIYALQQALHSGTNSNTKTEEIGEGKRPKKGEIEID
ncbi:DUF5712 family protein [Adhaeribacter aquaticus]|uniref:DUF5712 family protein n=1 Tax=Adhaeribacter aquaticus TaxID=299567 RepID=UPI000410D007|nr:DUF5712 family protein [Adhaeribacter aquaticus]